MLLACHQVLRIAVKIGRLGQLMRVVLLGSHNFHRLACPDAAHHCVLLLQRLSKLRVTLTCVLVGASFLLLL